MPKPKLNFIKLDLKDPFKFKKGQTLSEIELAYHTFGTINQKKDNVILVCHALTMDSQCGSYEEEVEEEGWWDFMVGANKPIDTNRFHIICINVLGGCKGSTGPTTINPDTKKAYGPDFPQVTINDMVRTQNMLLEQLGINHLHAVIGGSLGGMQALEWSILFPNKLDKCIAIATGARLSTQGLAFDIVGRQCILNDPDWHSESNEKDEQRITGLALARMIGHITYISKKMMDEKFGRKLQKGWKDSGFNTAFAIESFLKYQSEKFVKRFDATSYLYLTKAMDSYDMASGFESLADSLTRVQCKFLIISLSSDWLFPPDDSIDLAWSLSNQGKEATYANIQTNLGHDAFLIDIEEMKPMKNIVKAFL
jgi:homoserine O-acetyltransferase/O-succinyltransferase